MCLGAHARIVLGRPRGHDKLMQHAAAVRIVCGWPSVRIARSDVCHAPCTAPCHVQCLLSPTCCAVPCPHVLLSTLRDLRWACCACHACRSCCGHAVPQAEQCQVDVREKAHELRRLREERQHAVRSQANRVELFGGQAAGRLVREVQR